MVLLKFSGQGVTGNAGDDGKPSNGIGIFNLYMAENNQRTHSDTSGELELLCTSTV